MLLFENANHDPRHHKLKFLLVRGEGLLDLSPTHGPVAHRVPQLVGRWRWGHGAGSRGSTWHFARHTGPSTTLSPSNATHESSWASGPRRALSVSSRTSASSPVACWSSSRVMVRRTLVGDRK